MKIAIVSSSYPATPVDCSGLFVQAEAEQMYREGHDVTVLAPGSCLNTTSPGPRVEAIASLNAFGYPGAQVKLRKRPWRLLGHLAFVLHARRRLRQLGPFDAVYAHWLLPSGWPICAGALDRQTSLEIVLHGGDVRLLCALPRLLRCAIVSSIVKRGATLRFVSQELRAELAEATGAKLIERSYVRACQADTAAAPSRQQARALLKLEPSTRLAIIVARLVESKRVPVALDALTAIDSLDIVVIGGGPTLRVLTQLYPSVKFAGHQPHEMALRYIAAADVLVSASLSEGAPLAIREARQLGVPVVALAAGDLAHLAKSDPQLRVLAEPNAPRSTICKPAPSTRK